MVLMGVAKFGGLGPYVRMACGETGADWNSATSMIGDCVIETLDEFWIVCVSLGLTLFGVAFEVVDFFFFFR